jgi:glycosyltransferase involved in cell wall biosynthesis
MTNLDGEDAVTVVVPAYNAESTLDETLRSVRAQTHRALEILVVDDGSRDGTPAIALAHAAADPRVRLIRQDNAGVGAARNRGIEEARATLVAPVDADDLWAPAKIERQVATLRRRGPHIALVYTWSALIDRESRVTGTYQPMEEGDVLARMCRGNLVGNGSAALMRRDAVLEAAATTRRSAHAARRAARTCCSTAGSLRATMSPWCPTSSPATGRAARLCRGTWCR